VDALNASPEERAKNDPTRGASLIVLSVATSIDALAVGISLAALGVPVLKPALIIRLCAAAFTSVGIVFAHRIGAGKGRLIELFGGALLLLIGFRILIEHLWG
jgi:putative Mn2+ efflux pump MntP